MNKRLEEYFVSGIGHDVHTLECLFHVNEIYFTHAKIFLEGKVKGPNAYEDGALMQRINKMPKCEPENLKIRQACEVSITAIAANHIKAKILWLSEHKKLAKDFSFRSDHTCLLALAAHWVTEVLKQFETFAFL